MNLPTEFVTEASLLTVAGTATAIYSFLILLHMFGADRVTMMVLGLVIASLPQLVIALSVPHPQLLALVIAGFNTVITFLAAWFLYSKSIATVEKLLDGHH